MKITHYDTAFTKIEVDGVTLITDPVLGAADQRHSFGWGMTGTKTSLPIAFDDVGASDAILLSHDQHGDNLDPEGKSLLSAAPTVITTAAAARRLGGHAHGLAPFSSVTVTGANNASVRVTATPARHGPPLSLPFVGEVIGFVVEHRGGALYITGDTVLYRGVREVAQRFKVTAVLAHLGAASYGPLRFTMNAEEAVKVARLFPLARIVPIHFEGWTHFKESRKEVATAFAEAAMENRLVWLERGVAQTL